MNVETNKKVLLEDTNRGIEVKTPVGSLVPSLQLDDNNIPLSSAMAYGGDNCALSYNGQIIKRLTKTLKTGSGATGIAITSEHAKNLEYIDGFSVAVFGSLDGRVDSSNLMVQSQPSVSNAKNLITGSVYIYSKDGSIYEMPDFIHGICNTGETRHISLPKFVSGELQMSPFALSVLYLNAPEYYIFIGISGNCYLNCVWSNNINLPKLTVVNAAIDFTGSSGTIASLPSLKYTNGIVLQSCTVQSIQLPSLVSMSGQSYAYSGCTVQTLNLGTNLKKVTSDIIFQSNSFNQSTVDHILSTLASLDGTNGTTAYSSKTVTITGGAASPSAAGLTAKATLVSRGCTVTHN